MSAEPTMTCTVCGATEVVRPDGRGYPPDIARRRLIKHCKSAGHVCDPVYQAGFIVGRSQAILAESSLVVGEWVQ